MIRKISLWTWALVGVFLLNAVANVTNGNWTAVAGWGIAALCQFQVGMANVLIDQQHELIMRWR